MYNDDNQKKVSKLPFGYWQYTKKKGEFCMKSTGVVRKVDELGRVVLPSSIRAHMDIKANDAMEIFTDGERIVLQKYQPACIFCNDVDNVVFFNGKRICAACLEQIKSQF